MGHWPTITFMDHSMSDDLGATWTPPRETPWPAIDPMGRPRMILLYVFNAGEVCGPITPGPPEMFACRLDTWEAMPSEERCKYSPWTPTGWKEEYWESCAKASGYEVRSNRKPPMTIRIQSRPCSKCGATSEIPCQCADILATDWQESPI